MQPKMVAFWKCNQKRLHIGNATKNGSILRMQPKMVAWADYGEGMRGGNNGGNVWGCGEC